MQISVIMPCYNAGRWINDALRSIAEQSYQPHEVIVIDDGSTDDSVEKIEQSGVPVELLHTNRANAAGARNVGIAHATGNWIAFLDADDLWYANHLERTRDVLNRSDDVGYVGLNDYLYADDRLVSGKNHWPIQKATNGLSHQAYIDFWRIRLYFIPVTMTVRTDRLREIGGFDPSQVRRHDFDMWLRVIHGHTWSYDPTVTAIYRADTPDSISRTDWSNSEYYMLRGMVKNVEAYMDTGFSDIVQDTARRAMSSALTDGKGEDFKKTKELAWPYLKPYHKAIYRCAQLCPGAFRFMNRYRRKVVNKKLAEARNGGSISLT